MQQQQALCTFAGLLDVARCWAQLLLLLLLMSATLTVLLLMMMSVTV
jgi:hypothetical protein